MPYIPPRPAYPPKAPSLPGFLRAVRTNLLSMWPDYAYEREIFVSHVLGRPQMLLNAPEAIHRVLVENPANYRRSPATIRVLRPITGRGLLLSEGDDWKLQRRTIAPAMAPRVIPLLARHMASTTSETIEALRAHAGRQVDLLATMQATALEIAGRSMFAVETRAFGPQMRALLTRFGNTLGQPRLFDMVLPASLPTIRDLRRRLFERRWMALIDAIIAARLAVPQPEAPGDLFDLLRWARDPETGRGFSRAELRDQVATMIVAGHETTAITLFWSFYLLANAPLVQERMAREVACVALDPDHAGEALGQLPYTRAVVSEALRLYPPVVTLVRLANGQDRAGAIDIPAGAILMIAPWVLHRHRRLWRDPDAFDPDRFMPGEPPPPRFAYLPFGAGPRVCVGAQFAIAEAVLVLAQMVQAFAVRLAGAPTVLPRPVITAQPDSAPGFVLSARGG